MKKRSVVLSVLLTLVLVAGIAASCGGSPSPTTTAKPSTPATTAASTTPATSKPATTAAAALKLPETLNMTCDGGVGSSVYSGACAIAPAIEKGIGVKIRVTPLETIRERYQGMREGKFHFSLTSAGNVSNATEGDSSFAIKEEGPQTLRQIWYTLPKEYGFFCRGDDKSINTIYDIKGKKIALGMHSPSCMDAVYGLLAFVGITEKDVTLIPLGSWDAIMRSVTEGKADVSFGAGEGALTLELEQSPHSIKWLDMPFTDKNGWNKFLDRNPTSMPLVWPRGVQSAVGTEAFASNYTYTVHSSITDDVAYAIARYLGENYDTYKKLDFMMEDSSKDKQREWLTKNPFPVHPGAIKYYKEIGFWTAKDDQVQKEKLDLEAAYAKAWQAALAEANAKNIKIDIKNDEWMNLWKQSKSGLARFKTRLD